MLVVESYRCRQQMALATHLIIINIISEAIFTQFGYIFETLSQRFDLSARSLGHVMVWLAEIAQEAGAGGRSGAIPGSQTIT